MVDIGRQIEQLFMGLTRFTCPHGFEQELYDSVMVEHGLVWYDKIGYLGSVGNSKVLFTAHLDTASRETAPLRVRRVNLGSKLVGTDNTTLLGADNKAGVSLLLYMMEQKVPGNYAFYIGEERGCIGSTHHALNLNLSPFGPIEQVVSFDREGYDSIITHQMGMRTCSDAYAGELASRLNVMGLDYSCDPTGAYTDSNSFAHKIPECTNISVGAFKTHTTKEYQDLGFLTTLASRVGEIDWETLPIERDPAVQDWEWEFNRYPPYNSYDGYGKWDKYEMTIDDLMYNMRPTLEELHAFVTKYPDQACLALDVMMAQREAAGIEGW